MIVEAVLLTGGLSRRMGQDKAGLVVKGEPMAARLARLLASRCGHLTVLGREPLPGHKFLADSEESAGPLSALSKFVPTADFVFVAACDLALFDPRLIDICLSLVQGFDACLPVADGHPQPLCALYRATAWSSIAATVSEGKTSMMAWLDSIRYRTITAEGLKASGIDPRSVVGANTPEEWAGMTGGV